MIMTAAGLHLYTRQKIMLRLSSFRIMTELTYATELTCNSATRRKTHEPLSRTAHLARSPTKSDCRCAFPGMLTVQGSDKCGTDRGRMKTSLLLFVHDKLPSVLKKLIFIIIGWKRSLSFAGSKYQNIAYAGALHSIKHICQQRGKSKRKRTLANESEHDRIVLPSSMVSPNSSATLLFRAVFQRTSTQQYLPF